MDTQLSLLERIRDKDDAAAWDIFARRYMPLMIHTARRTGVPTDAALEVAQDCFLALIAKMPRFRYEPSRGRFRAFLHIIARRRSLNWLRRNRRRIATDELVSEQPQARESSPTSTFAAAWRKDHVKRCIQLIRSRKHLNRKRFAAFKLRVIHEWPVARICKLLNMTSAQVYDARMRGMEHLTRILRQYSASEERS